MSTDTYFCFSCVCVAKVELLWCCIWCMGIQWNKIMIRNAQMQTFKLLTVCERWCHFSVEWLYIDFGGYMVIILFIIYAKLQLVLFSGPIDRNCMFFSNCMKQNCFELMKSFYFTDIKSVRVRKNQCKKSEIYRWMSRRLNYSLYFSTLVHLNYSMSYWFIY